MSRQLEIPFEEYADKTIPIPFEEDLADALQQDDIIQSKKDCKDGQETKSPDPKGLE